MNLDLGSDGVELRPKADQPAPISLEVRIASTALLIAGLVVLAYIGWFVESPIGEPADWGAFGDFFGGLVNPVVGLATVLLVVRNLQVTRAEMRSQLDHFTTQAKLTDLYRRLEGTLSEWTRVAENEFFTGTIALKEDKSPVRLVNKKTLLQVIHNDGYLRMLDYHNSSPEFAEMARKRRISFRRLRNLTIEIGEYCSEYQSEAANHTLADYYRRRVWRGVMFMEAAGILTPQEAKRLEPAEL